MNTDFRELNEVGKFRNGIKSFKSRYGIISIYFRYGNSLAIIRYAIKYTKFRNGI